MNWGRRELHLVLYLLVYYTLSLQPHCAICSRNTHLFSLTSLLGLGGDLQDLHEVLYVIHLMSHHSMVLFLLLNVINLAQADVVYYLHLVPSHPGSGTCGRLVLFLTHSLPAPLLTSIVT